MSKHAKRAVKRGRVLNSREIEALHKIHNEPWRQAKGSHRTSRKATWYKGDLSPGVSRTVTKALKACGWLCIPAAIVAYCLFA